MRPSGGNIIQCHTKSDYVMIENREMPGPSSVTGDAGPHDPVTLTSVFPSDVPCDLQMSANRVRAMIIMTAADVLDVEPRAGKDRPCAVGPVNRPAPV